MAALAGLQFHVTNRRIARGDARPNTALALAVLALIVALSAAAFIYVLRREGTG